LTSAEGMEGVGGKGEKRKLILVIMQKGKGLQKESLREAKKTPNFVMGGIQGD